MQRAKSQEVADSKKQVIDFREAMMMEIKRLRAEALNEIETTGSKERVEKTSTIPIPAGLGEKARLVALEIPRNTALLEVEGESLRITVSIPPRHTQEPEKHNLKAGDLVPLKDYIVAGDMEKTLANLQKAATEVFSEAEGRDFFIKAVEGVNLVFAGKLKIEDAVLKVDDNCEFHLEGEESLKKIDISINEEKLGAIMKLARKLAQMDETEFNELTVEEKITHLHGALSLLKIENITDREKQLEKIRKKIGEDNFSITLLHMANRGEVTLPREMPDAGICDADCTEMMLLMRGSLAPLGISTYAVSMVYVDLDSRKTEAHISAAYAKDSIIVADPALLKGIRKIPLSEEEQQSPDKEVIIRNKVCELYSTEKKWKIQSSDIFATDEEVKGAVLEEIGFTLQKAGKIREGRALMKSALEYNPKLLKSALQVSDELRASDSQEDREKAGELLRNAVRYHPEDIDARVKIISYLGNTHEKANMLEALEHVNFVLEKEPNDRYGLLWKEILEKDIKPESK